MKALTLFICLCLTNCLLAQPPLPSVDDGSIVVPIDQPIAIVVGVAIVVFLRIMMKKRARLS